MRPSPRCASASGESPAEICSMVFSAVVFAFIFAFMALDSFPGNVESWLFLLADRNRLHHALRRQAREIDRQQAVLQVCAQHFHSFRQHEGALELPRGDAAVNELPVLLVLLAP